MAKSKLIEANEKIAESIVGGYKKVEQTVVGGYKKVEQTVVDGYKKIEDAFVGQYLTHEGETVKEAKARLNAEQEEQRIRKQEQMAECVRHTHEKAHVPDVKE